MNRRQIIDKILLLIWENDNNIESLTKFYDNTMSEMIDTQHNLLKILESKDKILYEALHG